MRRASFTQDTTNSCGKKLAWNEHKILKISDLACILSVWKLCTIFHFSNHNFISYLVCKNLNTGKCHQWRETGTRVWRCVLVWKSLGEHVRLVLQPITDVSVPIPYRTFALFYRFRVLQWVIITWYIQLTLNIFKLFCGSSNRFLIAIYILCLLLKNK